MGAVNLPAGSQTNNGLGIMATLPSVAGLQPTMLTQQPLGNSGDLLAQQQAAYAAAMGASLYGGGAQFGMSMSQPVDPHFGTATASHMMAMSHAHSRTTSIADGAVATYSNGDSNGGTPQSGIAASAPNMGSQPMTVQLQQQLQQHQFQQQLLNQQQQQSQLNGLSANASAVTSANQSGAPSPFATTPLPTANQGNPAASIGHRRQQSSSFLAAMQQQPQAMYVDPPMALATAPPTLVPGTPTPFGQLQFHMHGPGTATAPQPLSHLHASPFGHSRHLSLDAANFRLMAADTPSMTGFPAHETIHEYPVDMVQHA
ncbi:hypothetical protein GGF42_006376, partial [Coemansia sp. RSA 2424]